MDTTHAQGQEINPQSALTVGLQWDEFPNQEIDLDLQCILLNELGQIDDAVYYNQLQSKISKIKLSEDSHGEKAGYDELLTIDLNSCPFQVKYVVILICSYKEQPLTFVESSKFHILQNDSIILETSVGAFGGQGQLSLLPSIFEKSYDGKWRLFRVEQAGKGKNFIDNEELIKKGLINIGFDQILFEECKNWKGGKTFNLEKNKSLVIPTSLTKIFVGLGWDTRCDIDSSILLFDKNGKLLENIYFGKKSSQNGSILHHGDNLMGDATGDDEVITINLNQIDEKVATIWSVITIFNSAYQFDDVKGAYCRLFCSESKSEFCKFNLSENKDGVSTGNIMCCITRCQGGSWAVSPKGFYVKKVNTSAEVVKYVEQVLLNDFSQVKTIDQIQQSQPKSQPKPQSCIQQPPQIPTYSYFLIQIINATGLASFDSNGFSDPYVILKINGKKITKTSVVKKCLNPTWNFSNQTVLNVSDRIEFKIFDHDTLASDDYMGSCYLTIESKHITNQSTTFNLEVLDKDQNKSNKYTGILNVSITKK